MSNRFTEDAQMLGGNGGFGFGGGGILEGLLFASLLGRRGGLFGGDGAGGGEILAGDIASKVVELQNTADLKAEMKDVESGLRETILNQTIGLGEEFRSLDTQIGNAKLDAVKAQFEAKIASLESTQAINNRLTAFEVSTDKQFCHVNSHVDAAERRVIERVDSSERRILDKIADNILEEKNDLIAQLRTRNNNLDQTLLFSNQINGLAVALNNISQKQDLTNQTIQFGTGNVATPTANNNQVGK